MRQGKQTHVNIPFVDTRQRMSEYHQSFHEVLSRVLDHGNFILGEEVETLEQDLQKFLGVDDVVTVGNGTEALLLCLKALGIGAGDEVVTTSLSYLASTSCIALSGAEAVFADVGDDLNLLPSSVEDAIGEKTKAILVVHLAGNPADMGALRTIADRHGILLIEDCAQAFGAKIGDQYCGSFGDLSAVSFHPLKTLGALGDAGAVICRNEKYSRWLRMARNHGHSSRNECEFWSVNSRLDGLQAGFLQVLLKDYDDFLASRVGQAKIYQQMLGHLADRGLINFPVRHSSNQASYGMFVICVEARSALQNYLTQAGVETKIHYPTPIHQLKAAKASAHQRVSLLNTERYAQQILSLPLGPHLSTAKLRRVAQLIIDFFNAEADFLTE